MGVKIFMISFLLASLLLTLLYIIPTEYLTTPIFARTPKPPTILHRPNSSNPYPLSFAYLISASKGDVPKLKRLLSALYHPNNIYLIHLDSAAPPPEHKELAWFVAGEPLFQSVGNVMVVGKPNLVTYRGPTMLATTLHAMAMLLRCCQGWDWFINLSASDYPLVTQDDLIDAFSDLPRDLNFIQHSSRLGWKLNKRGKPIMIDPGLYSSTKSQIWWAIKQRGLPTAFKLFTGSAWTILSRSFAEYCIVGYENLPRTLLLYYTNFVSSPEGYFQTLVCNSATFRNTTVNHDLHFISWDNPPRQHPRSLGTRDYKRMVASDRPFARKFRKNNPVLDRIDLDFLRRRPGGGGGGYAYGGWCSGDDDGGGECTGFRSEGYGVLRPGPGAKRLKRLLEKIVWDRSFFYKRQCR